MDSSTTAQLLVLFSILIVVRHAVGDTIQNQSEWSKPFKPEPKPKPIPHHPIEWPKPFKPEPKPIPHPVVHPKPIHHRPSALCASQFALANSACSKLPYKPVAPPSPALPLDQSSHPPRGYGRRSHHHGHGHHGPRQEGGEWNDDGRENEEEMGQNDHSGHGHRRRRHGHHHHHHRHALTTVEYDCCRWLREIDSYCVCDMLVYLPPFLTRPVHEYSAVVEGVCNITYACPSRIIRA